MVFDHFHVIRMMNDTLDRIRRKESSENEIIKHARQDLLKNSSDLPDKESDLSPLILDRYSVFQ